MLHGRRLYPQFILVKEMIATVSVGVDVGASLVLTVDWIKVSTYFGHGRSPSNTTNSTVVPIQPWYQFNRGIVGKMKKIR